MINQTDDFQSAKHSSGLQCVSFVPCRSNSQNLAVFSVLLTTQTAVNSVFFALQSYIFKMSLKRFTQNE